MRKGMNQRYKQKKRQIKAMKMMGITQGWRKAEEKEKKEI